MTDPRREPARGERPRAGRNGAVAGVEAITSMTHSEPVRVDPDRLDLGLRQVDSLANVFAASVLGDTVWRLDDLELRLAAIRLLDTAARNITVAVGR